MTRAHTPRSPRAATPATLRSVPETAAGTPPPSDATTRVDGWDLERQTAFLRALSATHSVSEAAKSVGRSRQSAYRLRSRLKGQPFDLAWEVAFHHSFDVLAHAALERHAGPLTGLALRASCPLRAALAVLGAPLWPAGDFRFRTV